jgi:hypothetical protein
MTRKSEIAQDQEVIVEKEDIIRVDQIQENADIEGMIVERGIVENTEGQSRSRSHDDRSSSRR